MTPARVARGLARRYRMLRHRGHAVTCPVCGHQFSRFRDDWNRPNAICWRCGAHERHRALWLFFERRPELLTGIGSLLHFAPEWGISQRLRRVPGVRYVTADLEPGAAQLQLDVTSIQLDDGSFDAIICSHVLEHVEADRAAMAELHRVLRRGGWAIVMVPIDFTRTVTYEDPQIRTPQERVRAFWQSDHLRLYAPDIEERLGEAGFSVTGDRLAHELDPAALDRYRLHDSDVVFLCRKRD